MAQVAVRHSLAVEWLDPQPADRILEVGCGHGIASGLVCGRLSTGKLVAVDRSATMIAAAARRNAATDRLTLLTGLFEEQSFPDRFDRAFAINVDFARQKDHDWAAQFARVLKPGGMLLLVLEAPAAATAKRFSSSAEASLRACGFTIETMSRHGIAGVRATSPT